MRGPIALSFVLLIAGRIAAAEPPAHPTAEKPASNPAAEFLLASAATDFHEHAPHPVRFRHVRSGYATGADGTKQFKLCGEFLPAAGDGKAEWTSFVTIKTSGYEQYIGGHAADHCKGMKWDKGDLSPALQSRFDASK